MDLGLITVHTVCNVTYKSNQLIGQYNDVFEGLGCTGDAYHIDVDITIRSQYSNVPQQIPVAMKEPLKHKLAELLNRVSLQK